MDYERKILTKLIDRYENRASNQNGKRKVMLDVSKAFPNYMDAFSVEHEKVGAALEQLRGWGYISGIQDVHGYYPKIYLVEEEIPHIYGYLERTPKDDVIQEQRAVLMSVIDRSDGITKRFCSAMLDSLTSQRRLGYGIKDNTDLLKDIIQILIHIEQLNAETYIRNFSEMVFHDSKRFQQCEGTVCHILRDFGNAACAQENILEQYNLFHNPSYIYIKGGWILWCSGRAIYVEDLPGGIAVSSKALSSIERIEVSSPTVISVENLTTYHDVCADRDAILYLGGFLNSARADFLRALYRNMPDVAYYHKGDIDPYGFLILEDLKQKTQIPFLPLEMDLATLKRCHLAGHYRSLDAADRKVAQSPQLECYRPLLDYMLKHDCKIEQECFEAMKIEFSVCS